MPWPFLILYYSITWQLFINTCNLRVFFNYYPHWLTFYAFFPSVIFYPSSVSLWEAPLHALLLWYHPSQTLKGTAKITLFVIGQWKRTHVFIYNDRATLNRWCRVYTDMWPHQNGSLSMRPHICIPLFVLGSNIWDPGLPIPGHLIAVIDSDRLS